MRTVVIDTNVYISALLSPQGAPAKIMKLVQGEKLVLLVSYSILNECISTALYPAIQKRHGLSKKQVEEKIFRLTAIGKRINPENRLEGIHDDPDDNIFLECAVEGGADYIISGDKHLKSLKSFSGIKILAPAAFLNITD